MKFMKSRCFALISLSLWVVVMVLPAVASMDPSPSPAVVSSEAMESSETVQGGVRVLRYRGVIHALSAMILDRALENAAAANDRLFILELDTPGGLVTSAESMVESILASEVPVCVYVAPRGAHAASAGFFLLMAADCAAMAPITRTGAAHPIMSGAENKRGDIQLEKASEDLAALIRSIAGKRGRPVERVNEAVMKSRSWSEEEALAAGLIDLVVASRDELIAKIDGRVLTRIDGSTQRLDLVGSPVTIEQIDWHEELRKVLLTPTTIAILLLIGIAGIYIEVYNPGSVYPGAVGVISLALVLYAARYLPIQFHAVALVVLGVILFLLEIKVTSFGALTVGGTLSIALGLWLLFPATVPALQIGLGFISVLVLIKVSLLSILVYFVVKAQRRRATTGVEGLLGEVGVVTMDLQPEGTIDVHGEYWRARARGTISAGTRVRVVAVEGTLLLVEAGADPESE